MKIVAALRIWASGLRVMCYDVGLEQVGKRVQYGLFNQAAGFMCNVFQFGTTGYPPTGFSPLEKIMQ